MFSNGDKINQRFFDVSRELQRGIEEIMRQAAAFHEAAKCPVDLQSRANKLEKNEMDLNTTA
jgi:hypothetical protein